MGGKPISCISVSAVAYPPAFFPLCDENSIGGVKFAGSSPTFSRQTTGLLVPLPSRNYLTFWGLLPLYQISWTGGTRYSAPSVGWRWLLAIHCLLQWSGVWGTLRAPLFSVSVYMLRTPYPPPTVPHPLPDVVSSYQIPTRRECLWVGGGSVLPISWAYHRLGRRGGVSYLPLESLPCSACGSAQSESWGWCMSALTPCRPPLETPLNRPPKGRISCIYWGMGGGGVGGLQLRDPNSPILGLLVCRQQPCRQVRRALWEPYLLPLSLLEGRSHPRNPLHESRLQLSASYSSSLINHPHRLIDVSAEFHPAKEARQHAQCRLEAGWPRWIQEPVIGI